MKIMSIPGVNFFTNGDEWSIVIDIAFGMSAGLNRLYRY